MSIQVLPIHRTNNNNTQSEFDAFNFTSGQDKNVRWLNKPNQQIIREKYGPGSQKFRITFDAENFQPEQIKVKQYIDICIEYFFCILFRFIFKIRS